ncbi:MAG: sterol desaturase family protein [Spirochaetota bacterium]
MEQPMINPETLEYEFMRPVKKKEPIRLFTDDRLERLAHTPPLLPSLVWMVVIVATVGFAVATRPGWYIAIGVALGVFVWTLAEYLLHRYVFHIRSENRLLKFLGFAIHGIHHAQPMVETRLVMPLAAGIPIAAVFYGIFYLIAGLALQADHWVLPIFGGFILGYEIYSFVHYAVHAYPNLRLTKGIRRHHLLHHGKDFSTRFGVSSALWDRVLGTYPKD